MTTPFRMFIPPPSRASFSSVSLHYEWQWCQLKLLNTFIYIIKSKLCSGTIPENISDSFIIRGNFMGFTQVGNSSLKALS
jgi:hypothetical protein